MKSSHSYHKHSVQALIFLMGMILFPLQGLSQTSTTNPSLGGPQIEYDPTPKALEMTRYGQIPVNGNSGQITFEIPLYTYSDQDFNIPVSLSYASSGGAKGLMSARPSTSPIPVTCCPRYPIPSQVLRIPIYITRQGLSLPTAGLAGRWR